MKLPQWAIIALGFVLTVLTWVLATNAKGDFTLPATVIAGVSTALQIVKAVLGLTTDSVKTTLARARVAAKFGSAMVMLIVLALASLAAGCTPAEQQKGAATIQPAAVLLGCVVPRVIACATSKPVVPWGTCTEQTALACGTDVAGVVSVWASYQQGKALESASGGVQYP